jgi:succinoglycan biosynthesis protein ExoO/succinoglycan biosynthesis protein ExoU
MRVSVIVAAYNAAQYLNVAVDSISVQTERDLEVLVVDDASTDATAEIVAARAARDPRIRLVRAPVNAGPGAARNLGLAAARGDWIAILDADDRFHPQRLERLLDLAGRHGSDIVADNQRLCPNGRPDGTVMFSSTWLPAETLLDPTAFLAGNTSRQGRGRRGFGYLKPLIRRGFLQETGLRYDDDRFAEDFMFSLRCLLRGARWVLTPEALYDYTVRDGSGTTTHSAGDLARLIARERALLDAASGAEQAALRRALRRHLRTVELALAWFRFAEALKRQGPAAAAVQMVRDPGTITHILGEGLRAAPRVLARVAPNRAKDAPNR